MRRTSSTAAVPQLKATIRNSSTINHPKAATLSLNNRMSTAMDPRMFPMKTIRLLMANSPTTITHLCPVGRIHLDTQKTGRIHQAMRLRLPTRSQTMRRPSRRDLSLQLRILASSRTNLLRLLHTLDSNRIGRSHRRRRNYSNLSSLV